MSDPSPAAGPTAAIGPSAAGQATAIGPSTVAQAVGAQAVPAVPAPAADQAAVAADPTPDPIVDFDAGGSWGAEAVTLKHPFKLKGVVYTGLDVAYPTGLQIARFYADKDTGARLINVAIGMCKANGAPIDMKVWGVMRADDCDAILTKASAFLFGPPATSQTSSTTSA